MAVLGVTAKIELEEGSGWWRLPSVRSLSFPEISVAEIDTTSLDITDFAKTFAPGLIDGGSITVEYAYSSASYVELHSRLRQTFRLRVTSPTGQDDVFECDAFITALSQPFVAADEVIGSVTFKSANLPALS